ncbi:hypothetical protein AVEN_187094-1, partial [Araneus ventricosus]
LILLLPLMLEHPANGSATCSHSSIPHTFASSSVEPPALGQNPGSTRFHPRTCPHGPLDGHKCWS